jgi:predicted component of type VI protein secretion system
MKRLIMPLLLLTLWVGPRAAAQDTVPSSVQINEIIPGKDPIDEETGGLPITVYFVVLGEGGRPLPNPPLSEEGAKVIVDGEPFAATLERYDGPSYVTFVVDNSRSMAAHMGVVGDAFLQVLERKPDEVSLALRLFRQESDVQQDFTADPLALREAARGLVSTDERDSCLYDAAFDAANSDSLTGVLAESPQAMRAVVLIGDGVNNGRCDRHDDRHVDELIEFANSRRVTFYSARFSNNAARPEDVQRLERLAESTGGMAFTFQDEEDLTEKLAGIVTGLNTQWQARATVFTYTAEPISLNLELRARGQADATTPLPSTSIGATLGIHPPPNKRLRIGEFDYLEEERLFLVTLVADHLTSEDCATLKLRDTEANEIIEENPFCWQQGEGSRQVNLAAPDLVAGRPYGIELYSDDVPPPEGSQQDEPLSAVEYRPNSPPPQPTFDFRVLPVASAYDRLELQLIGVTTPDGEQISYEVNVAVDGTPEYATGRELLSDPTEPIVVSYYPEGEATDQRTHAEALITLTLTWPDDSSPATVEKSLQLRLRPRASAFERLANALRENPVILGAILLILVFALLYFIAMRRLNRLDSAVVRSPVRGPTQVPPPGGGGVDERQNRAAGGDAGPADRGNPDAGTSVGHQNPGHRPESHAAPPALTARPPLAATLRVLRAPDVARQNEIAVINRFPFRIGREGCELTLGDGRTSRHHASIQQIGDQLVIIDKNSKNGTFLNDAPTPLTPGMRWPLQDGDRIRLGATIELRLSTHPTGDSALSGGKPTEP